MLLGVNLYKRKNFKFFFGLPETRTEKELDKSTGSSGNTVQVTDEDMKYVKYEASSILYHCIRHAAVHCPSILNV